MERQQTIGIVGYAIDVLTLIIIMPKYGFERFTTKLVIVEW